MPVADSPLIVIVGALGLIVLICRWVFSRGQRPERSAAPLGTRDYGLLVPLTVTRTREDAEMLRDVLLTEGIRAGISDDLEVRVFREDLARARRLVGAS